MKKLIILLLLMFCSISYAQPVWQELPSHPQGGGITALATSETGDIFATTASFNHPQVPGGVNRSTDGGTTWENLFPVYTARTIDIADDGTIFASIWDWPNTNEGIYKSTNNGDDWQMVFDVGTNNNIFSIESGLSGYYAGSRTGLLYSSDGTSWGYDAGFPSGNDVWVRDIEMDDSGIPFVASYAGVYYKSGLNWVEVPGVNPGDTITVVDIGGSGLLFNGENVTADDDGVVLGSLAGHVYSGTASGVAIVCYLLHEIAAFILEEGINFAGVYSPNASQGGVFDISTGLPDNEGLPSEKPLSAFDDLESRATLKIIAGFFYNNAKGAKIYTRDFVTSVEDNNSEIPQNFSLGQNYPNPFNPSTTIRFSIPAVSYVTLEVFNALGEKVSTLVSENLNVGTYKYDWNAESLTSGIYFYRLSSENFIESKKMILLK